MKILVCADGSKESKKAMEKAAVLAGCYGEKTVDIIHVYDDSVMMPGSLGARSVSGEQYQLFTDSYKKEGNDILRNAEQFFLENGIKAKKILKGGHPAQRVTKVAAEEGYDLIIVGSRGLGGLKRLLLGSVSNALLQEAKTNVLVVK